jgi:hypothetical protein
MGCAASSEPCEACDELAGQWIRRPRTNVPQNPLLTGSNACSSAPGATQVQECAAHPAFAADGLHVERRRDRTTSLVPPAARRARALHDHSLPPIENHVNVPGSSHMPSSFRASPLISLRVHQTFSSTTHGIAGDIGTTGSRLACKGSSQNPSQRPIAVPNKPVFLLADPVIAREDRVAITYSRRRSQPSVSKASLASVAAAGGDRPCVVVVCRSLASSRTQQRQLSRSVCRVPSISSEVSYATSFERCSPRLSPSLLETHTARLSDRAQRSPPGEVLCNDSQQLLQWLDDIAFESRHAVPGSEC